MRVMGLAARHFEDGGPKRIGTAVAWPQLAGPPKASVVRRCDQGVQPLELLAPTPQSLAVPQHGRTSAHRAQEL